MSLSFDDVAWLSTPLCYFEKVVVNNKFYTSQKLSIYILNIKINIGTPYLVIFSTKLTN